MSGPSILVVDDDPAFRGVLERLLCREGFQVLQAEGGKAALRQIQVRPPNVLIVDLIMPDADGIEVISATRAKHRTMGIIAVSGRGEIGPLDLLDLALKVGADVALAKPFDPDDLVRHVRSLSLEPAHDCGD